jgi:capsular exopolysaccharide synthesis family protein
LAFILEQIDEALSDPEQVERDLKVSALGTVPLLSDKNPIEEIGDRKSELAEAYLSVETALKFSTPEGLPRSLLVTSTQPSEGKSTTSISLAITMARLGYRTLLIDGDMRSPSVHDMLGVANSKGLSDILSGNSKLDSVVVPSGRENLFVVPAGHTPPNAAELLSGLHLDELIGDALGTFDALIIDAPPVMGLADAPLIASKVAGCLMVVEANRTRARQASVALKRLESAHANILGVVLTKINSKRAHYGYGYEYGYGYGADHDRTGDAVA